MSTAPYKNGELTCNIDILYMNLAGATVQRKRGKNARLVLGRAEQNMDLAMLVDLGNKVTVYTYYRCNIPSLHDVIYLLYSLLRYRDILIIVVNKNIRKK